jgi:flagellar assembly protein FliH
VTEIKPNVNEASPFELPRFDEGVTTDKPSSTENIEKLKLPTAEEISAIREAAHEDGFRQGYEEGLKQSEAENAELRTQFTQLMAQFEQPLEQERESVIEQLADLCILVTRQIIRREIQNNPEQVVAVVRDAIKLLPASRRRVTIQMHPEDANLLRKIFSLDQQSPSGWQIADDPSISRGGCLVTTETSKIDATVEKRISEIFAHVFGDLRTALDTPGAEQSTTLSSNPDAPSPQADQQGHDDHG